MTRLILLAIGTLTIGTIIGFVLEMRAARKRALAERLARKPPPVILAPWPAAMPPGVVIGHAGCEHDDAKTIQRDVSPRGLSETKWCRDCGALYEHAMAGRFRHGPRWTEPRKPEQKW